MVGAVLSILSDCASDDWRIPTTAPATAPDLKDQFEDFYQSQLSVALPPLTPPLTGLGSVLVWADRYFNLSTDLRAVLNKQFLPPQFRRKNGGRYRKVAAGRPSQPTGPAPTNCSASHHNSAFQRPAPDIDVWRGPLA